MHVRKTWDRSLNKGSPCSCQTSPPLYLPSEFSFCGTSRSVLFWIPITSGKSPFALLALRLVGMGWCCQCWRMWHLFDSRSSMSAIHTNPTATAIKVITLLQQSYLKILNPAYFNRMPSAAADWRLWAEKINSVWRSDEWKIRWVNLALQAGKDRVFPALWLWERQRKDIGYQPSAIVIVHLFFWCPPPKQFFYLKYVKRNPVGEGAPYLALVSVSILDWLCLEGK